MGVLRLILFLFVLTLSSWGESVRRMPYSLRQGMIFGYALDQSALRDESGIGQPMKEAEAMYSNGAWLFDGTDDGIVTAYRGWYDLSGSFTLSAWCKLRTTANATFKGVIDRENSGQTNSVWAFLYDLTADSYSLYTSAASGTNPYSSSHISVTNTNWNHIAYTYRPGEFRKYLNGRLQQTYAITFTLATSTHRLAVGCFDNTVLSGQTNSWDGSLKYVYGWNRALQPSEMLQLYREQFNKIR